jgi:hypothetical protein
MVSFAPLLQLSGPLSSVTPKPTFIPVVALSATTGPLDPKVSNTNTGGGASRLSNLFALLSKPDNPVLSNPGVSSPQLNPDVPGPSNCTILLLKVL